MNVEGHLMDVFVSFLIFFILINLKKGKLLVSQKLYIFSVSCLAVWLEGVNVMQYVPKQYLWIPDAFTCCASGYMVVSLLLLSIIFTKNVSHLPGYYYLLYILPGITAVIAFTNPIHHLFYTHFSIYASEVAYGPLFFLSGGQYYFYSLVAIFIMFRYAAINRHGRTAAQAVLFITGLIVPLMVNVLVTLKILNLSIAATPLAFLITLLFHGIAVYHLNFLNIKPLAIQNMVDNISEGYVIFSSDSCIVYSNSVFDMAFGAEFGMKPNVYLKELVEKLEERKKNVIYNLLNFFDVCKQSVHVISYEQPVLSQEGKIYYSVELTPVVQSHHIVGVIAMFRDVTQLKEELQKKQQNLSRAMERERLISLGQMIGSISHNLKTPIMAISGNVKALDNLVEEYRLSIGDSEVTIEDHYEICKEMTGWLNKTKECCAYMSDIITTVKGMAANLSTLSESEFPISEVLKRVQMFLKSKLVKNGCRLVIQNELSDQDVINGDINNLVQVLNNLVDNACDAMENGGGDIILRAYRETGQVILSVCDSGCGIPDDAENKLFRTMYTSKGINGTGLGLYSSEEIIKGKFGGKMWFVNNPEKGVTFFVSLPEKADK